MKTREEINELAEKEFPFPVEEHLTIKKGMAIVNRNAFVKGYTQCQEDMLALLRSEILSAFIHGQGNARGMEAGLERDETDDYVNSRMASLHRRD